MTDTFQCGDGLAHPGLIVGFPEFGDHGQTDTLQPAQKLGLRLRRFASLDRTKSVEDGAESAPGHDRRIEEFERAGRGVAGIGEKRLALFLALRVERGEFFLRQVNLPTNLDQLGNITLEPQRNGTDGADVLRDIVSCRTVAARGGQLEKSAPVSERKSHTVDFRFDRPSERDSRKQTLDPRHEFIGFLERVGVVQTLHRDAVANLLESFKRFARHAPGGGIRRAQVRMSRFQIDQLAEQGVVFPVGDLGLCFSVVELVVMGDLSPEFTGA